MGLGADGDARLPERGVAGGPRRVGDGQGGDRRREQNHATRRFGREKGVKESSPRRRAHCPSMIVNGDRRLVLSGHEVPMSRRGRWVIVAVVVATGVGGAAAWRALAPPPPAAEDPAALFRKALWLELQPVSVEGCVLERFGERGDGGYLLCGNLLEGVTAGYSYGISGYDGWGCDVATKRGVPVHQYRLLQPHAPGVCGDDRVP